MKIKLINCSSKFSVKGIDINSTNWQSNLFAQLQAIMSFDGWQYDYDSDSLVISTSSGVIPDLSGFGEVVQDGDTIG